MPKVPLTGMTLNMLSDGYTGKMLDEAMKAIVKDIEDRGHDRKKRTLTLQIDFLPHGEGQVSIYSDVKHKLPSQRPPATQAKYNAAAGGLVFNPDCAENPDQQTFEDAELKK